MTLRTVVCIVSCMLNKWIAVTGMQGAIFLQELFLWDEFGLGLAWNNWPFPISCNVDMRICCSPIQKLTLLVVIMRLVVIFLVISSAKERIRIPRRVIRRSSNKF